MGNKHQHNCPDYGQWCGLVPPGSRGRFCGLDRELTSVFLKISTLESHRAGSDH